MKKLVILFFGAGLFLTSCGGDYTCTCTTNGVNTEGTVYKGVTKAWMKNQQQCVSKERTTNGVITTTECEIEKK